MTIAWLNDYTPDENLGGSQQTQKQLIKIGLQLGHEIAFITPSTVDRKLISELDVVVLNNIQNFDVRLIKWIINKKKYVKQDADYDVANNIKKYPDIYKKSVFNTFRSPMLLEKIQEIIGYEINNVIYISSVLDTSIFFDWKQTRIGGVLWVGNAVPQKGVKKVLEFVKEKDLQLYSVILPTTPPNECLDLMKSNSIVLPPLSNEQMPEYYNMFTHFIHLPEWNEPTGRSVIEALLCGSNMIVDLDKVGWFSYDWDFKNRKEIKMRLDMMPYTFWVSLNSLLN